MMGSVDVLTDYFLIVDVVVGEEKMDKRENEGEGSFGRTSGLSIRHVMVDKLRKVTSAPSGWQRDIDSGYFCDDKSSFQ
jgi:hypothetical protein